MENMNELIKKMHLNAKLSSDNIPDLDLYMDQVIQLFDQNFMKTKRVPEEKIVTKTMINNYSKAKLFFPVKNKKYSREHIMLIHLIYEMKTVLSMKDIKQALVGLNDAFINEDFPIEEFYDKFTEITDENIDYFHREGIELEQSIKEKSDEFNNENEIDFEKLLLILSFINRSNFYRRAAELLIDELDQTSQEVDE